MDRYQTAPTESDQGLNFFVKYTHVVSWVRHGT